MHVMPIWSTSERNSPTLQLREYFEILDLVKEQLASRFSNPALGALLALQNGKMTAELRQFCVLHQQDPETVERQLDFTFTGLRSDRSSEDNQLQLSELFRNTKIQPALHYMLDVARALPVTSCSAERAFSRLRLIKSHLRTTMSATRLQSLLRISANKVAASAIPLEKMLDQFTKTERKLLF